MKVYKYKVNEKRDKPRIRLRIKNNIVLNCFQKYFIFITYQPKSNACHVGKACLSFNHCILFLIIVDAVSAYTRWAWFQSLLGRLIILIPSK